METVLYVDRWHVNRILLISCVQDRKQYLEMSYAKRVWYYVTRRNFPLFKAHRHHEQYNASNILDLGQNIFDEVLREARQYGYSL